MFWAVFLFVPHLQFAFGACMLFCWGIFVSVAAAVASPAAIAPSAVVACAGAVGHLFGKSGHCRRLRSDRLYHRHKGCLQLGELLGAGAAGAAVATGSTRDCAGRRRDVSGRYECGGTVREDFLYVLVLHIRDLFRSRMYVHT